MSRSLPPFAKIGIDGPASACRPVQSILPCKPISRLGCDSKLGAVGVLAARSHKSLCQPQLGGACRVPGTCRDPYPSW